VTEPILHTPEEAAYLLGISRSVVFELLANGSLKSVKIGRSRRISRNALDSYVANAEQLSEAS
jgi:excisionase family DNA binding protein